ncbi:hypothetical protein K491DRAFT_685452 [Lophiostoma macrostomum CBS 122681]|uniref:Uncharacterized protein n=1 Tax=Lophiostoma macrostomum CBS 122681 TaxID=1314788 RepID=A0A6A6SKJ8_9PLEO|nr:hypothetical protein K491DRAFT_685452 [Lophiostoma macrostomum CBS 122681]
MPTAAPASGSMHAAIGGKEDNGSLDLKESAVDVPSFNGPSSYPGSPHREHLELHDDTLRFGPRDVQVEKQSKDEGCSFDADGWNSFPTMPYNSMSAQQRAASAAQIVAQTRESRGESEVLLRRYGSVADALYQWTLHMLSSSSSLTQALTFLDTHTFANLDDAKPTFDALLASAASASASPGVPTGKYTPNFLQATLVGAGTGGHHKPECAASQHHQDDATTSRCGDGSLA